MNYAVVYLAGILFFAMLWWVVRGRKYYTGPLIEAEVNEDASVDRSSDDDAFNRKTEQQGSVIY